MKKGIIAVLFIIILVVLLASLVTAAYEPSEADLNKAPEISDLSIRSDKNDNCWLELKLVTPESVYNAIEYYENHESGYNQAGYIGGIEIQYQIDGGDWKVEGLNYSMNYNQNEDEWSGIFETETIRSLNPDSEVKVMTRYEGADANGNSRSSDWSNVLIANEKGDYQASEWAQPELLVADKLNLIPDSLRDVDLTLDITREEFAEVSVKAYEALTGKLAKVLSDSPFEDVDNEEVTKAYNLGITKGTSETTFEPTKVLNRETAATMLTRTYKKATFGDWTLDTDDEFPLDYEQETVFDDDEYSSDWARDSVYFMNANGIINGVGNNKFAPRTITTIGEAIEYANATREQAIIIAARMVNNLKEEEEID